MRCLALVHVGLLCVLALAGMASARGESCTEDAECAAGEHCVKGDSAVDCAAEPSDGGGGGLSPDFHQIRSPSKHRSVVHPNHGRFELIGDGRWRRGAGEDVAPAHVDVIL